MVTELTDGSQPQLAIVSSKILRLDEVAGEYLDRFGEVDSVLEDIGLTFGFIPFEVHRLSYQLYVREGR